MEIVSAITKPITYFIAAIELQYSVFVLFLSYDSSFQLLSGFRIETEGIF